MRNILAAVIIAWSLTGCTTTQGNMEAIPVSPTWARPIASPESPASPSPTIDHSSVPVGAPPLTCTPPTEWIMDWLGNRFNWIDRTSDDVTMVEIGQGDKPGPPWWAVTFTTGIDSHRFRSMVTTTPSLENPSTGVWYDVNNVDWTGDRLDRLNDALDLSYSCINQASSE